MVRAWHLFPVTVIACLWHVILAADYLLLRYEVGLYVSGFTPDQLAWFRAMPQWMAIGWGIGVWSGVFATMRLISQSATGAFYALSFAGWAAASAGLLWLRDPPAAEVTGDLGVLMLLTATGLSLLLFLYTRWMHRRTRTD